MTMCLRVLPLLALALAAGMDATAAGAEVATSCPIVASTDFAIYGQTSEGGVAASSRRWMAHFFDWWKAQDPDVDYVFLTAAQAQACRNLKSTYPNLRMWVQPGGNAYDQQGALGATGKANINGFIDKGGAYLGVCAGAYYAAPDYWWEGEHYAHPHLLGAYPRTMEGAISRIAPWPGYAMTVLSNGRNAIYYGGPTIGLQHTNMTTLAGEKVASFASIEGQLPAVIIYGNLLLTSVHLEAFEDDESSGLSTADRIENYRYLATLINRVARTNFRIPGTAP
jgi:Biotin-protein ligase, N terminal